MEHKEYTEYLQERNEELEQICVEHAELEHLINWLQDYCIKEKAQFCGIQTVELEGRKRYVGFALMSENVDKIKKKYVYNLFGFLGEKTGRLPRIYVASLMQHITGDIPDDTTSRLEIVYHNVVFEQHRDHGIGTCAMFTVKDLAKHLHCEKVTGKRVPMNEVDEEKLRNFYEKNGFSQHGDIKEFSFDVTQYRSDTGKLI